MNKKSQFRMLSRMIAGILSVLVFISSVGVSKVSVKAADIVITNDFMQTLAASTDTATPVNRTMTTSGRVFLQWNISQMGSNPNVMYAAYQLKFFIDNGKQVVFTVLKQDKAARVTYDVQTYNSTTRAWESITPVGYEVYTNVALNVSDGYVAVDTFLRNGYNVSDADYQVLNEKNSDGITIPAFRIKQDRGFAIKYDSRFIFFKWNSVTRNMEFVIDGIIQGRIYEFTLAYNEGQVLLPTAGTTSVQVTTGISSDTFRSIPYANNSRTAETLGTVNQFDIDTDLNTMASIARISRPAPDDSPGSDEQKIKFRFDMPVLYNTTTNTFSRVPSTALPVQINLSGATGVKSIQIRIADITKTSPVIEVSPTAADGGPSSVTLKRITTLSNYPNRIEVELRGMPAGVIYDPVVLSTSAVGLSSQETKLPFGKVFTFLQYDIITQGGKTFARISPYKGYTGQYLLKSGAIDPTSASIVQSHSGSSDFMIPVSIASGQVRPFQLFFAVDEKPFDTTYNTTGAVYSQIATFTAPPQELYIDIPDNFQVLDERTQMYPQPNSDKSIVNFTTSFDIANKTVIESMLANKTPLKLTYELYNAMIPNTTDITYKSFASVDFEITSFDPLQAVCVSTMGGTNKIQSVTFATRSDFATGVDVPIMSVTVEYRAIAVPTDYKGSISDVDMYYPNIYFLNVRPNLVNGTDPKLDPSLFDSLTLNSLSGGQVPPPYNLTLANPQTVNTQPYKVSLDTSFEIPATRLKDYFDVTYPYPSNKIEFNFYVAQDSQVSGQGEQYMRETFSKLNATDRRSNSVTAQVNDPKNLFFSNLNGADPVMTVSGYASPLEAVRNGKVLRIEGIVLDQTVTDYIIANGTVQSSVSNVLSFVFDGLDKNQKYIVYGETIVTHEDPDLGETVIVYSILSNLVSMLTKTDQDIPTGTEKVPPAPTVAIESVDLSQVTINWSRIPATDTNETVEYEIIRMKGQKMDDALAIANKTTFETLFASLPAASEKAGWATTGTGLQVYNGSAFSQADTAMYVYNNSSTPIKLTDKSLMPNQLYFYYVRAVRIMNGVRIASTWNGTSATTTPVKSPVNLKIDNSSNKLDRKTSIAFSFDAPLTDLSLLGTSFNLQYQIQKGDGEWSENITMDAAKLKASATVADIQDYYHFVYTLTGLSPGTAYSLRVRMTDATGDGSIYTNILTFVTDMDQKEYDDEKKLTDWLAYYKQKLLEILTDPYLFTKNSTAEAEMVYRQSELNNTIMRQIDSQLKLAPANASKMTYFIPSGSLLLANERSVGFKVTKGNMDIIISPKSITANNDATLAVAKKIKAEEIVDYMLRATMQWTDYAVQVDGNQPISKLYQVNMDIIGTSTDNTEWDNNSVKTLMEQIDLKAADVNFKNAVKKLIDDGAITETIQKYVDSQVATAKTEFASFINSLHASRMKVSASVSRLEAPMILQATNVSTDQVVNAYQLAAQTNTTGTQQNVQIGMTAGAGNWMTMEVVNMGSNKGAYAYTPGTYIFTGRTVSINGLSSTPGAGDKTGIVAKYGLDDIFGRGELFNIDENTSRYQLAASIARIAGAPKAAEPFDWLNKNKGISLSARNQYNDIQTQEAIFMVMSLYAAKTNTKINSIQITNYNIIKEIEGIDDAYRQSINAAFQIGIYTNKKMIPTDPISVGDMLNMLYALDGKVKL